MKLRRDALSSLAVGLAIAVGLVTGTAPASATILPRSLKPFTHPVAQACISSPFGPRTIPDHPEAGTFHHGIDIPAPEGAPVRAIGPGQVIRVQHQWPGGLEMSVQHDGFVAVYSHLGQIAPLITAGRTIVRAGQPIATVGRTGLTFGVHLHIGFIVNGRMVDPAPVLRLAACGAPAQSLPPTTPQKPLLVNGQLRPTRTYVSR